MQDWKLIINAHIDSVTAGLLSVSPESQVCAVLFKRVFALREVKKLSVWVYCFNFLSIHKVYGCFSYIYVCAPHVYLMLQGQRKASDPLGLELHAAVSHHGCWQWGLDLWWATLARLLSRLSHLFSLTTITAPCLRWYLYEWLWFLHCSHGLHIFPYINCS